MDEGRVLTLKSVKNDMSFCACDSKIQNDEKVPKLHGHEPRRRSIGYEGPVRTISEMRVTLARAAPRILVALWSARPSLNDEYCRVLSFPRRFRTADEGEMISIVLE